jgi:hypothetical protein
VRVIFHCGARSGARKGKGRPAVEDGGLLDWAGEDRAIAEFASTGEVRERRASLARLVRQWLAETAGD